MDDIVKQAMRKWPHVPHCYGWLGLDMRGDWYMRDDAVQAQGAFAQAKGAKLLHDKLIEFIARNYEADARGCWYFQNGPQRVYVELIKTPWVWRWQPNGEFRSHTGEIAQVIGAFSDEDGCLYLHTPSGLGLVHTQDVGVTVDWIEQQQMPIEAVQAADLPDRFGYVLSPQALNAK